uniref:FAR1 domain-containing protein n=1 Tax=Brassica oleracea var. oleracea TaxID=109376 RepID=A0A0D3BCE0_BRAOL
MMKAQTVKVGVFDRVQLPENNTVRQPIMDGSKDRMLSRPYHYGAASTAHRSDDYYSHRIDRELKYKSSFAHEGYNRDRRYDNRERNGRRSDDSHVMGKTNAARYGRRFAPYEHSATSQWREKQSRSGGLHTSDRSLEINGGASKSSAAQEHVRDQDVVVASRSENVRHSSGKKLASAIVTPSLAMESSHSSDQETVSATRDEFSLQISSETSLLSQNLDDFLAEKDASFSDGIVSVCEEADIGNKEDYIQTEDADPLEANNENQNKYELLVEWSLVLMSMHIKGLRQEPKVKKSYSRPTTRCGCKACMSCYLQSNGRYKIMTFEPNHNHDLVRAPMKHLMKSNQTISISQKQHADDADISGISAKATIEMMSREAWGRANLDEAASQLLEKLVEKRNL